MTNFDYITATDFDRAWLNFELDLPLKPDKNGGQNLFLRAQGLRQIDRAATSAQQSGDSKEVLADQFQYPGRSGHRRYRFSRCPPGDRRTFIPGVPTKGRRASGPITR